MIKELLPDGCHYLSSWLRLTLQSLHLCTSLYRHSHRSIDRDIAALLLRHMEALLDLGEGRSGGRTAGGEMVGGVGVMFKGAGEMVWGAGAMVGEEEQRYGSKGRRGEGAILGKKVQWKRSGEQ